MKEVVLNDFKVIYPEGKRGLFGSVNNSAEIQNFVNQYESQYLNTIVSLDTAKTNLAALQAMLSSLQSQADSRPRARMKTALGQVIPEVQAEVDKYQAIQDKATANQAAQIVAANSAGANAGVSADPLNTSIKTSAPSGGAGVVSTAVQTGQAAVATSTGFFHTHKNAVLIGGAVLVGGGLLMYILKKKA